MSIWNGLPLFVAGNYVPMNEVAVAQSIDEWRKPSSADEWWNSLKRTQQDKIFCWVKENPIPVKFNGNLREWAFNQFVEMKQKI